MQGRAFRKPLVLAIPRGGIVTGAALARQIGAELDVVLSRKLRAPAQPELAIGAISETGDMYLNQHAYQVDGFTQEYLDRERQHQLAEISRRRKLFRGVRPQAPLKGRTVIVTDDGIATGSTMIAALQTVKQGHPYEIIVAVPVASPDRLIEVRRLCDEVICLLEPQVFWAVGQFYEEFNQVEDDEVVAYLRDAAAAQSEAAQAAEATKAS